MPATILVLCARNIIQRLFKRNLVYHTTEIYLVTKYTYLCVKKLLIYTNFIKTNFPTVNLSLALKCIKIHFRNYCKVIEKRTCISFFWSVDNSLEFIDKISDIKTAHSIKTFDFSTLYTNLPLDVIYGSLKSLTMKKFANSKSIAILVNSYRKKAFWSNGSSYPGYREYTIDKLLKALEIILFNTYLTVLFSNRYLAYLWVQMHHPSLPIYTYHGVNIAMWLN